jgi:nucleoside deoxyribosyltransferase
MLSVYFAGPDIFFSDYKAKIKKILELSKSYGVRALVPGANPKTLDPKQHFTRYELGVAIYGENIQLLEKADAVVANLSPFRSPVEPDCGTAFEVGFAAARGKCVIGYLADRRSMPDRISSSPLKGGEGSGRDATGAEVESFDNPVNLMLACSMRSIAPSLEDAVKMAAEILRDHQELEKA